MVLETDPIVFWEWILPALLVFLQYVGIVGLAALTIGYLITAFRYGPIVGGDITFQVVKSGFRDLLLFSPRRTFALARLSIQESIRRRVLVAFVVFLLILLFAGWFLDSKNNDPATLYLSFVLNATLYLVLLIALFLSAFSLPADIKNRTIYTVVTKPVRASEIVLGRILGFSAIGTVFLATMGLFSYFFVVRILDHTHEIKSVGEVASRTGMRSGQTTTVQNHHHEFQIDADGVGSTDMKQGHWHEISSTTQGGKTVYTVGPPEGLFTARVPVYGQLQFKDRNGDAKERGISVGQEWAYRSYIEGRTAAAAIWTFRGITPQAFPDGLPLEMTIRVFRSHKGEIDQGIRGSLMLRNPETGRTSGIETFPAKDNAIDRHDFPRKLQDPSGNEIDLFEELVTNDGELQVWLQCEEPAQYFGVAQADMYLRASDSSFAMNFIKGYLGLWLQMILVTGFGVMFSTFLNGAVAMIATVGALILGFFTQFVFDLAAGKIPGGGPIESLVRIVKQQNVMSEMEEGFSTTVIKGTDAVLLKVLEAVASILPDFTQFDNVNWVAAGFDVSPDRMLAQMMMALAYTAGVFIVGYFFLKTREVAR